MGKLNFNEILEKIKLDDSELSFFDDAHLDGIRLYKSQGLVEIDLHLSEALPFNVYASFIEALQAFLNTEVDLRIISDACNLNSYEVQKYLHYFLSDKGLPGYSRDAFISVNSQEVLCLFSSHDTFLHAESEKTEISAFFFRCGISYNLKMEYKAAEFKMETVVVESKEKRIASALGKVRTTELIDIQDEQSNVKVKGKIFDKEVRNINRTNKLIATVSIYDTSDAIAIKIFEGQQFSRKLIESLVPGQYIYVEGNAQYDKFSRELVINANRVTQIDDEFRREDNAEKKRIELHAHTKKSEMDGVANPTELIKQAYRWGHDAIAITDHMVVQAFPEVQRAVDAVNSGGDHKIKPIYGVEMNMVDDELKIVSNGNLDADISDRYLVFDIETTGLSNQHDHIIEFGAVIVENGVSINAKQLFIKPPVEIPAHITSLTGISDKDVKDARTIEEVLPEILEFFADLPLVAHNADFDIDFVNAVLQRCERKPLSNLVIDTLNLARVVQKDRRNFRLGNVARFYGIVYDEEVAHRADYDAEILGQVFSRMLNEVLTSGCRSYRDIQNLQGTDSFRKQTRNHITVLARNTQGLKDLFKLVTLSHTKYLSVLSKSTKGGDEYASEPRILRSVLNEARQNLLLGSACYSGEIFEIAANKSEEQLIAAMQFYDYIEIQPPSNYNYLLVQGSIPSQERLLLVLETIVKTAEKLGKVVVATGDLHYLNPEDKIYRDVYISAQGIGGVRHPLYIYDNDKRHDFVAPDQHFRTTGEMLEEFHFLGEEKAELLVIDNAYHISQKIELIHPVKDKLYTPHIDGADDNLRRLCFENAQAIYGSTLPKLVADRLEKELNSIISHGFAVIYYISYLLVQKSLENGYLVGSRGSVGSSFVATMANITEVNPLPPHYICFDCHYSEFVDASTTSSGYDLEDKICPACGSSMKGEGQDIPFETFLGFEGDKVPDIDLNFSGDFQEYAHAYTKEVFGASFVYRAGTIGTVAERTAFGYVSGYCEEKGIDNMRQAQRLRLAKGCEGVKRTTGQHPGGIIVIPQEMDVHDFTPVQFPANNPGSDWQTTHFEFNDIHDNVLKLDILGHVDPTAMKLLEESSGIDVRQIPMNDKRVMSLFNSTNELNIDDRHYAERTGALGLPEFGTTFVRSMLEATKPSSFSDLVRISGLSHGTDVWLTNARELVASGKTLQEVICCRDDIMVYLIQKGLDSKTAFDIMENVRKGRGLNSSWINIMKMHNIPDWYIESCQRIKYMFPKAHAVAYVMMAVRVAWFKVYHPHYYYQSYFTLRCDAYEIETMIKGKEAIERRLIEIQNRLNDREEKRNVSNKEIALISTLEVALEMQLRGYRFSNLRLNESAASTFLIDKENPKLLIPPFSAIDGLGENVGRSIIAAREENPFLSKEDLLNRTQLSSTLLAKLDKMKVLAELQDENQMSLF